jgi:hypothetical protein
MHTGEKHPRHVLRSVVTSPLGALGPVSTTLSPAAMECGNAFCHKGFSRGGDCPKSVTMSSTAESATACVRMRFIDTLPLVTASFSLGQIVRPLWDVIPHGPACSRLPPALPSLQGAPRPYGCAPARPCVQRHACWCRPPPLADSFSAPSKSRAAHHQRDHARRSTSPHFSQRVPYSQNIRTRLPTRCYAPTIARTWACLPPPSHGYSPTI